jgi:amino-acid N-acetyltransferase
MKVEKARIGDVQTIYEMIKKFADKGEMLPRALSDLYENLRDYFVIRNNKGDVIACIALHVNWEDLAEIRSLVVNEDQQYKGLGSTLVKECVSEAQSLGIKSVFCLTYKPEFFEKHGFRKVEKTELPKKAWSECYRCPKFPDCGEVALLYKIN